MHVCTCKRSSCTHTEPQACKCQVKTEIMLGFKGSSLLWEDSASSISTDIKSRATENMNETFVYTYMHPCLQILENVNLSKLIYYLQKQNNSFYKALTKVVVQTKGVNLTIQISTDC